MRKISLTPGGGAIFMLKNYLNMPFFSKNTLFFGKYLPGGGEFVEKSLPGGREFGKK